MKLRSDGGLSGDQCVNCPFRGDSVDVGLLSDSPDDDSVVEDIVLGDSGDMSHESSGKSTFSYVVSGDSGDMSHASSGESIVSYVVSGDSVT